MNVLLCCGVLLLFHYSQAKDFQIPSDNVHEAYMEDCSSNDDFTKYCKKGVTKKDNSKCACYPEDMKTQCGSYWLQQGFRKEAFHKFFAHLVESCSPNFHFLQADCDCIRRQCTCQQQNLCSGPATITNAIRSGSYDYATLDNAPVGRHTAKWCTAFDKWKVPAGWELVPANSLPASFPVKAFGVDCLLGDGGVLARSGNDCGTLQKLVDSVDGAKCYKVESKICNSRVLIRKRCKESCPGNNFYLRLIHNGATLIEKIPVVEFDTLPVFNSDLLDHDNHPTKSFTALELQLSAGTVHHGAGFTVYKIKNSFYVCGILGIEPACPAVARFRSLIKRHGSSKSPLRFAGSTKIEPFDSLLGCGTTTLEAQLVGGQDGHKGKKYGGSHGWCVGGISLSEGGVSFKLMDPKAVPGFSPITTLPLDILGKQSLNFVTISGSAKEVFDGVTYHHLKMSGIEIFGKHLTNVHNGRAKKSLISTGKWYKSKYNNLNQLVDAQKVDNDNAEFIIEPVCGV